MKDYTEHTANPTKTYKKKCILQEPVINLRDVYDDIAKKIHVT